MLFNLRRIIGWMLAIAGIVMFSITGWTFFFSRKDLNLKGKIDTCCSEYGIIKELNDQLNPFLLELTKTNFFRLYKVDLDSKCPFWALNHVCKNAHTCGVCVCEDKEIPEIWKRQDAALATERGKIIGNKLDYYMDSLNSGPSFNVNFRSKIDTDWTVGEEEDKNGVYVDLGKNIEAFTGYQGQNIWNLIYKENCFKKEQCLEERLLNRAISGMHSSVSSHLTEYFIDFDSGAEPYPNTKMYFEKVGNHEDRIKNLYFAYTLVLRAFKLAGNDLLNYDISTQNFVEDAKTRTLLQNAVNVTNSYSDVIFDENAVFKDASKANLKFQLKEYFYNISLIMNCVECEKCKTYGKLQIKGLGTALKILFDEQFSTTTGLKRNELIAFVNTLTKWSTSLIIAENMFNRRARNRSTSFLLSGGVFFVMVFFSFILMAAQMKSLGKMRRRLGFLKKLKNV